MTYEEKRVSWKLIIEYFIIIYLTSFIVFLMLQVVWADLIREYVDILKYQGQYEPITFILFVGFFFVFIINFVISTIVLRKIYILTSFFFNVVSFIFTLISFMLFTVIFLIIGYSSIFGDLSLVVLLSLNYNYMSYLAIYGLTSPIYLWFIFQFVYYVFFFMLLKTVVYEREKMKILTLNYITREKKIKKKKKEKKKMEKKIKKKIEKRKSFDGLK